MRIILTITLLGTLFGSALAAELRIRGLNALSESQALNIIGGRLASIKSRPASPARADDAAFILERLLKTSGFTNAEVIWSLEGERAIVLTVKEGRQSLLGKISVEGIPPGQTSTELSKQFRSAHGTNRQLSSETPYLPESNTQGLANASQYLQSIAYWDASVELTSAEQDDSSGLINVSLLTKLGTHYQLAAPRVQVAGIRQPELEDRLASIEGKPATTIEVRKARRMVEQYYLNEGHQLAVVEMFPSHANGRLSILFRVTPGHRYTVGKIEIVGTERVHKRALDRRFRAFDGQQFRAQAFEDEIRRIYSTGAFESVRLEPSPQDDDTLDITIRVQESKPDGYYAYGGVGSLEGPILGAGYYHRNLLGNLWNFSSGLEISGIGLLGDVRVTEPWFLGQNLRFTSRAYAQTRSYDGYDKSEIGGGVELGWNLGNNYSANLSFYNSYVNTSADGIAASELGPEDYFIHRLSFEQSIDQRNNTILPTDGYFIRLNNELGLTFDNESVSYFRTDARFSAYQPVFEKSHIAFNMQAGLIIPSGDSENLPIDLRYFLGGASTVRSFPERELGPSSNGYPRGGEAYWSANLEYIHTLKGLLRGLVFFDAGNLSQNYEDFGSGRTNVAAGLGLRFDLPIGPVRLEYGHNLNPDDGDPSGAFHFAIGTTF
jgi:outer membrane protein insertion porin family